MQLTTWTPGGGLRRTILPLTLIGAVTFAESVGSGPAAVQGQGTTPIVIGHRGASGDRPEHTLEAYWLAIQEGADYVEPDIVSTRDGVLVARHENEISGTTDVAAHASFAGRRTTKLIDGVNVTGWFTEDFTLAELKTLRARERLPQLRATSYDGRFEIPTLQEVIDLVARVNAERLKGSNQTLVGIYPETKHPTYFDSIGLSLEEPLVRILDANGYRGKNALVYVQSFETANLRDLAGMTSVPLVQLLNSGGRPFDFVVNGDPRTYADLATLAGLREIAGYAQGVGVNKDLVVPRGCRRPIARADRTRARRAPLRTPGARLDLPGREHVPAARLPGRDGSRQARRSGGRAAALSRARARRVLYGPSGNRQGRGGSVRRQDDLGFRVPLRLKRTRNPTSYFLSGTNRIPAASRASDAALLASSCSACCTRNGVSPGGGCFRS